MVCEGKSVHGCSCHYAMKNALKDIIFQCRHLAPLRKSEIDCVDLKQAIAALGEAEGAKLDYGS